MCMVMRCDGVNLIGEIALLADFGLATDLSSGKEKSTAEVRYSDCWSKKAPFKGYRSPPPTWHDVTIQSPSINGVVG